jgi:hypothetical protein
MFHAEDLEKTVIGMPYSCFKSSSVTAVSVSVEYYQKWILALHLQM